MNPVNRQKLSRVSAILLEKRRVDRSGWYWIGEPKLRALHKKRANKYLLACTLDYQMKAGRAWENAKRLAEEILGDPKDLWEVITTESLRSWRAHFRMYSLHRFPAAHDRIWKIGKRIVDRYSGDARQVWEGKNPADATDALIDLGVGQQLSRMAVGGLQDCGWLKGKSDLKADIHVKRTLGRVFFGRVATEAEAIQLGRLLHPNNPWLVDNALWRAGSSYCRPEETSCEQCFLSRECTHASR